MPRCSVCSTTCLSLFYCRTRLLHHRSACSPSSTRRRAQPCLPRTPLPPRTVCPTVPNCLAVLLHVPAGPNFALSHTQRSAFLVPRYSVCPTACLCSGLLMHPFFLCCIHRSACSHLSTRRRVQPCLPHTPLPPRMVCPAVLNATRPSTHHAHSSGRSRQQPSQPSQPRSPPEAVCSVHAQECSAGVAMCSCGWVWCV